MRGRSWRASTVLAAFLAIGLAGCNTGGKTGSNNVVGQNQSPTANAGADQVAASGATVSLNGSGSDPDGSITSFAWIQVSGAAVTLNSAGTATPQFIAPVTASNLDLRFRLTVTDNRGATASDEVNVGVTAAPNQNPTANAGPDQSVASAATVTLAGSGTDSDGTIAGFSWAQISGPAVSLSNASAASPSFTAPTASTATALGFRLTVTDNRGSTANDDVVINVAAVAANQNPTASAGADQTVASGATVSLAGSGSDPDGSIVSFAWTQTSGTSIALSNGNTATPSFTAPTTSSNLSLGFRLTVTDNQGATASDDVVVNVTGSGATTVSVSGRVTYDRVKFKSTSGQGLDLNNPSVLPVRGATVQALSTGAPATVLASTQTDTSGNYSLTVPLNTSMLIRVRAETLRSGTPGWDFTVVDNTNAKALYVMDSASFDSGSAAQTKNLHAASGWGGSAYTSTRVAAPFAILDSIHDSFQKVLAVDATAVFPKLTINWSVNNVNTGGNLPAGMIGTSFYSSSELYILGKVDVDTDEFDDHIIIHEWGHYFEDKLSRSDSIGGEHSANQLLDMRVALGEGFGNALSGIVTDDPAYRDSSGAGQASDFTINVENNPTAAENSGWFSESTVQSVLYDLYDSTADGSDTVSLGWGPLYTVFVNEQKAPTVQTSIFTFITALKSRNPSSAAGINAILADQRINGAGIDDTGSQETNSGGAATTSDVLPIYVAVSTSGAATTVCSINEFGEPNKLSSRRFLTFTLGATANLTINLTGGVDPDISLHKRGQDSRSASTATAGTESLSAPNSPAGTYVLEVYDSVNTDGNTGTGGRACLNVSVTAS